MLRVLICLKLLYNICSNQTKFIYREVLMNKEIVQSEINVNDSINVALFGMTAKNMCVISS